MPKRENNFVKKSGYTVPIINPLQTTTCNHLINYKDHMLEPIFISIHLFLRQFSNGTI